MKSIKFNGTDISPSKIVCIGRNYVAHIHELNNVVPVQPVVFLKPNSSIANDIHPGKSEVIHYEAEISFLTLSGEIQGVGFGLDLTKRDLQSGLKACGLPWERAKAFDGAAVFSDFVVFAGRMHDLRMEFYINDSLVQQGGYDLMLYKPETILTEVKSFLSLEDGDLIMSGSPSGVGPVKSGDVYVGKIFESEKLLVEGCWVVK